jgi:hypothetical protein
MLPILDPPMTNGITRKFTGVMSCANLDVACIAVQVIQPMWNRHSGCQRFPVMVEDGDGFVLRIGSSFAIELPNQFSFFVSILKTGLPTAS